MFGLTNIVLIFIINIREIIMQQEKNFDFTFNNFNKEEKKVEPPKPSKFKEFMKMGATTLAVVGVVGAIGFGVHSYNEKIKAEQDQSIAVKEQTFKSGNISAIQTKIENEKELTNKSFAKNQILISRYAQYPELVKLLQLNTNLANYMQNNSRLLKETNTKLDEDSKKIKELQQATTRDQKVDTYLTKDNFATFQKWSAILDKDQTMYTGGLANLNKSINTDLDMLENTKNEITNKVKDRLKAKDFDLNKAQAEFSSQITKEKNKEMSEYTAIKNELSGTDSENEFSNKDLQEAQVQLDQIETETTTQIKKDRETIDKLIAEVAPATPAPQAAAQPAAQSSASNNFATYLLLSHWMNAGSTANYGAGYQAGVAAAASPAQAAIARSNPYSMNSAMNPVTSTKFAQFRNQINTRATVARTTISRSGGFGSMGRSSSMGG